MALFNVKWGVADENGDIANQSAEINCHADNANDAWCKLCAANAFVGKFPKRHSRQVTEIETMPPTSAPPQRRIKKSAKKRGK